MELDYFKEHSKDGFRYQFAYANADFWSRWNRNKLALGELGISLTHEFDSLGAKIWIVMRISKIENPSELVPIPPYIVRDKSNLLKYQVPAVGGLVASLMSNGVALDASDTGTGKTYTSLKAAVIMGYQPAIICTKTGIYDWKIVCKLFKVNPVFIYNWESCIGRVFKKDHRLVKSTQPPNPYIEMSINQWNGNPEYRWKISPNAKVVFIFDEIHKAGGNNTSSQKIVRAADTGGLKIMGLSATMCDKITKFRVIGSLIGLFEFDKFNEWLAKEGCFINNFNAWETINEKESMLKISKYIFPNYGYRVKKSEVPGFPDVQNIARLYQIEKSDLQNKKYTELLKKIEVLKEQKKQAQILVLQLRHRQIAETYKIPLLVELAKEQMEAGHSVVIFTCFIDTLDALRRKLKTDCIIQGGQKPEERRKNIIDFQADKERLIIANAQAGGVALSLHDLNGKHSRIALIPPIYDAKLLIQLLGRIHRAGAKSKAINYLVYSANTIEEKVFSTVQKKIINVNLLNDGDLADTHTFKQEVENVI